LKQGSCFNQILDALESQNYFKAYVYFQRATNLSKEESLLGVRCIAEKHLQNFSDAITSIHPKTQDYHYFVRHYDNKVMQGSSPYSFFFYRKIVLSLIFILLPLFTFYHYWDDDIYSPINNDWIEVKGTVINVNTQRKYLSCSKNGGGGTCTKTYKFKTRILYDYSLNGQRMQSNSVFSDLVFFTNKQVYSEVFYKDSVNKADNPNIYGIQKGSEIRVFVNKQVPHESYLMYAQETVLTKTLGYLITSLVIGLIIIIITYLNFRDHSRCLQLLNR